MLLNRRTCCVVIGLLALGACGLRDAQENAASVEVPTNQVRSHFIGLPNGATIAVEPGSVGEQLANYLASRDPAPRSFEIGGKQFDDWSATATPATRAMVPELVELLKSYPDVRLRLVGHSDGAGDAKANQKISEDRAITAKQMLVEAGISEDRIETEGRGMSQPIADNANVEGRARNRRIELIVIEK
ncbi:OmpA family protein [Sphingomonas cavernae]|nr:OmpA family protein [Sphingomonas cavernae]